MEKQPFLSGPKNPSLVGLSLAAALLNGCVVSSFISWEGSSAGSLLIVFIALLPALFSLCAGMIYRPSNVGLYNAIILLPAVAPTAIEISSRSSSDGQTGLVVLFWIVASAFFWPVFAAFAWGFSRRAHA